MKTITKNKKHIFHNILVDLLTVVFKMIQSIFSITIFLKMNEVRQLCFVELFQNHCIHCLVMALV